MYWIDTFGTNFAVMFQDEIVEIVRTQEEAEMVIDLLRNTDWED